MTYQQWITKQIRKGWKPPVLTGKLVEIKAIQAREQYLSGK